MTAILATEILFLLNDIPEIPMVIVIKWILTNRYRATMANVHQTACSTTFRTMKMTSRETARAKSGMVETMFVNI